MHPMVGPWQLEFYRGNMDARVAARYRIALGLLLLADLVDRLRDFHAFYTDDGLMPRAALAPTLGMAVWPGSPTGVGLLFAFGFVAIAAFTLGYRTRLATLATVLFAGALQARASSLNDGADGLLRILCTWMLFVDSGACESLDVRLRRRPALATAPALPLRILQLQIVVVYLSAVAAKEGLTWLDGSAVWRAVQDTDYARPMGAWLVGSPGPLRLVTWGTLLFEWTFPVLVFTRARRLVLGCGIALHVGILVFLKVGWWPAVMLISYVLFWQPRGTIAGEAGQMRPAWRALLLAGSLIVLGSQLFDTQDVLPTPLARVVGRAGMLVRWPLFAPNPQMVGGEWQAPGQLVGGEPIDLIARVVPEMRPDALVYSRWIKLRAEMLRAHDEAALLRLSSWMCRRAAARGLRVESFTLSWRLWPLGEPGARPVEVPLVAQRCREM